MKRRETLQRQTILSFLRETRSHPTADDIYETVRASLPSISKGTVYRNLKVLEETGMVSELNLDGTVSRYEFRRERHPHFRCERCGNVLDIHSRVDTDLDRRVEEETGLKIDYHQLEFRGLCQDCQNIERK
jgi:Fur family peroxide stress response transcriptional regulator